MEGSGKVQPQALRTALTLLEWLSSSGSVSQQARSFQTTYLCDTYLQLRGGGECLWDALLSQAPASPVAKGRTNTQWSLNKLVKITHDIKSMAFSNLQRKGMFSYPLQSFLRSKHCLSALGYTHQKTMMSKKKNSANSFTAYPR